MRSSRVIWMAGTTALVVSLVIVTSPPVLADGTADAWNDGATVGGSAEGQVTTGGEPAQPVSSKRSASRRPNPCNFSILDGEDAAAAEGFANSGWSSAKEGEGPGKWYRKVCTDEQGQSKGTVVWVADREAVDPMVLAEQAAERVATGAPVPEMADRGAVRHPYGWLLTPRSAPTVRDWRAARVAYCPRS